MQPQKVWVIIATLSSVKMTLNARINMPALAHFYIATLTILHSLRLQGRGAIAPLNPPPRNNAAQLSETMDFLF